VKIDVFNNNSGKFRDKKIIQMLIDQISVFFWIYCYNCQRLIFIDFIRDQWIRSCKRLDVILNWETLSFNEKMVIVERSILIEIFMLEEFLVY